MNPIRLVSGAIALPAHVAAAAIGASVGVATTGVRATARLAGLVLDRPSGSDRTAAGRWTGERAPSTVVDPIPATQAPAKKAPAKKAPAKEAPAKKTAAKKTAAKKAPTKRAPSKQAAVLAPALGLSEAEVEAQIEAGLDDDLTTPSGIPAAGPGVNPDTTETDLHQPGTEPLMDPATVKAVASESEVLRRGADTDKG